MSLNKKFRRGKKFQDGYFDIGTTNCIIENLRIEADCFKRNGEKEEMQWRIDQIDKLKKYLREKYDPELFDLDYYLPQISGLYVKRNKKCTL